VACANGANATTRSSCATNVAGAIDTSRRCRAITIPMANANAIVRHRTLPVASPSPGPPIISATPATASPIAAAVRAVTGSLRRVRPSSAASTGAIACTNSTCATVVWLSATMNDPEATARHTANPARAAHARVRSARSLIATYTSSATAANAARPATCVAAFTLS
jgi:hypothetical protein